MSILMRIPDLLMHVYNRQPSGHKLVSLPRDEQSALSCSLASPALRTVELKIWAWRNQ